MDWFQLVVTGSVVAVALYVAVEWVRFRGAARARIALAMVPLAILGPAQLLSVDTPGWETAQWLLLLALPILFMRVAGILHTFGWAPYIIVGLATVFAFGTLLLAPGSAWGVALLAAALVAPFLFTATLLVLGAWEHRGVARRRLYWTAGSGVAFGALLLVLVGGVAELTSPVGRGLTVTVAASYVMGLATPEPVRRAWRAVEFQRFVEAMRGAPDSVEGRLDGIRRAAAGTVEAETAYVLEEAPDGRAVCIAADHPFPGDEALGRRLLGVNSSAEGLGFVGDWATIGLQAPGQPPRALVLALRPERLFPVEDDDMLTTMRQEVQARFQLMAAEEAHRQARQAAEELARFRSQYLREVSHEIANPLSPLRLEISVLRKRHPEVAQASLDRMERAVGRIESLMQDVSTVARLSAARLELDLHPTDVGALVQEACDGQRMAAERQGCSIAIQVPRQPLVLRLDGDRVRQIIDNLVNNAIKYSPDGGLVHVELSQADGQVWLRVRDEGLGLDPHQKASLFTSYGRLHTAVAPGIRGTGMGLYIARELARLHGGDVVAESPGPGKGSTFTLRLPTSASSASSGPASQAPTPSWLFRPED